MHLEVFLEFLGQNRHMLQCMDKLRLHILFFSDFVLLVLDKGPHPHHSIHLVQFRVESKLFGCFSSNLRIRPHFPSNKGCLSIEIWFMLEAGAENSSLDFIGNSTLCESLRSGKRTPFVKEKHLVILD